jgi:hypothetical protein
MFQAKPTQAARFLISQQKYLEQLEAMQPTAALQTLRGELAVYCSDSERLHYLSRRADRVSIMLYFLTCVLHSQLDYVYKWD